jgi:hypothetical protein
MTDPALPAAASTGVSAMPAPMAAASDPVAATQLRSVRLASGGIAKFDLGRLPFVCPTGRDLLIFRSRTVSWEQIVPDYASRRHMLSHRAFARSFPSPGMAALRADQPTLTEHGLAFPGEGIYNVFCREGVFRILILPPTSDGRDAIEIARFFSANVLHTAIDVASCTYGEHVASAIYYPNLLHKLFRSDQPLGLICGQASMALCALLHEMGYRARQVAFELAEHFATEVLVGTRWVLVDPDFDCMVRGADGELLDADGMVDALLLGQRASLTVEPLSAKCRLRPGLPVLWGFYGQRSWQPDDHRLARTSEPYLERLERSLVRRRVPVHQDGLICMSWAESTRGNEPDTTIPILEQVALQRRRVARNSAHREVYDATIAKLDLIENRRLILRHGTSTGFDGPLKSLDCAYWLRHKAGVALELGLHGQERRRILDIGTGGGHFPFVCMQMGHEVVATDIDVGVYRDVCALLGVNRVSHRVVRGESLPDLGGRFDLVTAFAAQFDVLSGGGLWTGAEWREFMDRLILEQLNVPGRIFFTLNQMRDPATGEWRFKAHVGEAMADYDARVDPQLGVIDISVTPELIEAIDARRQDIPARAVAVRDAQRKSSGVMAITPPTL